MNRVLLFVCSLCVSVAMNAVELTQSTIVVGKSEAPVVKKAAELLADDVERVTGVRPAVANAKGKGQNVVIRTKANGQWEQFAIVSTENEVVVTGSDARGAAYGALHISEKIGVSPWYWFADVPVKHRKKANFSENYTSTSPSIKYRGVFINDEDWGLKTWSAKNYEKDLNDIGPKTYTRVCELLLRLKANMLAPAMHSCTGAFYSHPESQKVAAEYGIMITTSHCEPLLFNNAASSEWNKKTDGEWNYLTNKDVIYKKFDDRIKSTAQYDNIYTMGMRGLHDEAMKGSTDNSVRARTLEKVFEDQRGILNKYKVGKGKYSKVTDVPQIFVPYKETLDIYDAGLKVPEDITLVWPDDNYGYMKRVSSPKEQQRKGGSGVYYHLSYLGTPHDNLWIATTAPVLMYEELMKAYNAGADRYWLLNVGDIKPMEIEIQTFMDLAWNVKAYDIRSVNRAQAKFLAKIFGKQYRNDFQDILDTYYQLAWQRKPEFMGYEIEWDSKENSRLHDTDFSFQNGDAQRRLADYNRIATLCNYIEMSLPENLRAPFFEMLGFSVNGANQMNVKFLMAQLNHETGSQDAAQKCVAAYDSINGLMKRYNTMLDGKWNQMMSQVPPGFVALYQKMPELVKEATDAYKLPKEQLHKVYRNKVNLRSFEKPLLKGMGTDWVVLPLEGEVSVVIAKRFARKELGYREALCSQRIRSEELRKLKGKDTLKICVSMLPMWPMYEGVGNRFAVSVDGGEKTVFENKIIEWSPEWKLQVLENRKEYYVEVPVDGSKQTHTITLHEIDPGQYVQMVTFE